MTIDEKKRKNTPENEQRHDVNVELGAYKLAQLPFPGVFGVFFVNPTDLQRTPSKNVGSKAVARKMETLPISNFSKKHSTE